MKKLYLVDVSSMFFRAFFAIPPLSNEKGLPTNALYGFVSMSAKLLRDSRPDYMVYCFDTAEPSFRSEVYEDYKANRTEMPEDLTPQMPYIDKLTKLLGIPHLAIPGYEADDLIGSLAVQGAKQGLEVVIVSGDKDFAQLVDDRITMLDTMKNVKYDPQGVIEKWGVEPKQMIDYLSFVGDSSDNIPGIRGIGPKGAQKLLSEFKTLDGVYKNLDKVKGKSLKEKLETGKDDALLAKKLVTIVTDLDLKLSLDDMKLKPIDKPKLKEMFEELEFTAMIRKLIPDEASEANSNVASNATEPESESKSQASKSTNSKSTKSNSKNNSKASSKTKVAVGVEAKKLGRQKWSLSELQEKLSAYQEVWVTQNERGLCLGFEDKAIQVDGEIKKLGALLTEKQVQWKGFDVKSRWSDLGVKDPSAPVWDSQLAAYVLKAGPIGDFKEVYETYAKKSYPELSSCEDILELEMSLEPVLKEKLQQLDSMRVLETFELPLVPALYAMEQKGILINKKELSEQSLTLEKDIAGLEKKVFKEAGESFNISSPKQLAEILFEKLKLPTGKKTKTGFSTGSDVLEKLSKDYPICDLVIQYRELAKLKSTYVDALPNLISPEDGRLHTHFHQAKTTTGRLSSSNPNLQNIPIRTDRGRMIRRAFIAEKSKLLLSVDYSQIELRVIAEITNDRGLKDAFKKELDIHAATAAEIFNKSLKDVTSEDRRMAKAVNFGIAYGQGVYGLSEALGIERGEAKEIIESYFNKFKGVKEYMLDTVNLASEQGYVESLFGRKRYLDELKSSNQNIRKFGERAAINAPIQGTASDLMKKAMIEVFESIESPMLLQVHDELLFECDESDVEGEAKEIQTIMESVADFSVPLKVNTAWGVNWEDAHA